MYSSRRTTRSIPFLLALLLLLTFSLPIKSTDQTIDEDLDGLEDLLAVDEEAGEDDSDAKSSEAEVLSRAQRIVFELGNDNTKSVIGQNEFVLVLGYAPWCPRSAELMPRFAEAATLLKKLESPVLMAKLDADRYAKAASALDIKGFPTLLLFVNGTSHAYTGGFSAEEIVIWTRKKTGVPVIRISSLNEASEFVKTYHSFVVGLFEKFEGPSYEEFLKTTIADNELQFVEVSDFEVAKVLFPDIQQSKTFLGLVKDEPERYTKYEGAFEAMEILQFVDYNKLPLVTKLTEMNSVRVYASPIKHQVFFFADEDNLKILLESFQDVARKFRSKVMFIYIDITNENLAKPFLSLFGLEESENTVVAGFVNGMSSKFLLESEITASNVEEFCLGLLHGTLSPYFKSQPIPKNNTGSLQIVVGKTFDDLVLRNHKNVLLEVYTPWCITCETIRKHVEKLAKHFKRLDSLVFATIDASVNEHPKLQQINDYPTLLFYPSGNKENPIKLSTKSSVKDLASSINKHLRSEQEQHQQHDSKDEL